MFEGVEVRIERAGAGVMCAEALRKAENVSAGSWL